MTLFIHHPADDFYATDITCLHLQKIPPVISASLLPTGYPHGHFAPGVSPRITDTTCQSHPLQ
ncbi:hypothetical protein B5R10_002955 [Salmonella enterica subsp. enterica serovar Adelaide]|uniref:Uncharacterized protein n=1 Tax=Salmonella enterica subsp. enterica serovar Chester TaxID=149386 RepID=A0A5U6HSE9_SALET|nr:hypothetical protein [Salmonella enterica subsp. enterica serovar Chester]EAA8170063.1 hypothetical protein [Salmonella enterica]EAN8628617.1 hypothetical protein [Salmonella enterica subsp. enterica serovar Adelaide]EBO4428109.1 hypothetical protein [Salmonella enterica subsp. enterica]EBU8229811.1 hypothetical protein [Salmonella enterica subsp. enterica serovar Nima]EBY6995347.1 hypothetical protein [Salmonella enterica subsp. enterica serovar Pomona]ECV3497098.1 hypothetical protein [S